MKRLITSLLVLMSLAPVLSARAVEFDFDQVQPIITAKPIIEVGKSIIFDASSSLLINQEEPAVFEWDLGDGSRLVRGEEVVHTYENPGAYRVTLTVTQGEVVATAAQDVFVYRRLLFLLTDVTDKQEEINNFIMDAREEGTYISLIESFSSTTAFMSEEELFKKLREQVDTLKDAGSVVVWTTRSSGITALTRLAQEEEGKNPVLGKSVVVITDENLNTIGRIMQANFNIIQPKQMILVHSYELKNLVAAVNVDEFLVNLEKGLSDFHLINQETARVSLWNSISYLVSFMISKGIPSNTIVLLLMLPVIATMIAFLKQVVGITTFGLYTPSIITLSFLALGLKFGLLILFIIIVTGAILRRALENVRLLHIPRVAIVLTISSLIILLTLALGTYLGVSSIATIAVFPMLIMTTLAEKFVTALGGKGFHAALLLMLETTFVSLVCYWVVEWHYLQNLMLGHPEIILLLLFVNYGLGRWTGLRLMEYVRFREVMKHAEEE